MLSSSRHAVLSLRSSQLTLSSPFFAQGVSAPVPLSLFEKGKLERSFLRHVGSPSLCSLVPYHCSAAAPPFGHTALSLKLRDGPTHASPLPVSGGPGNAQLSTRPSTRGEGRGSRLGYVMLRHKPEAALASSSSPRLLGAPEISFAIFFKGIDLFPIMVYTIGEYNGDYIITRPALYTLVIHIFDEA